MRALDAANDGRLADLIQLFVKLEGGALTSELERPPDVERGGSIEVAHTLATQLAEAGRRRETQLTESLTVRSIAVGGRLRRWFDHRREELAAVFKERGVGDAAIISDTEMPPSTKVHWFRWQVNKSAHAADHYAEFRVFSGWSSLRIRVEKWQLRYVASLHGAGRDPGVMAVTTFAEIEPYPIADTDHGSPVRDYIQTTTDAFHFVHSEPVAQIDHRGDELEALLEEGLEVALSALLRRV